MCNFVAYYFHRICFSHLYAIYLMIRRSLSSTICIRLDPVTFKMSQTYNLEKDNTPLNVLDHKRDIQPLKVLFPICQGCSRGTMIWSELQQDYEEFWCNYCIYIHWFELSYLFI